MAVRLPVELVGPATSLPLRYSLTALPSYVPTRWVHASGIRTESLATLPDELLTNRAKRAPSEVEWLRIHAEVTGVPVFETAATIRPSTSDASGLTHASTENGAVFRKS